MRSRSFATHLAVMAAGLGIGVGGVAFASSSQPTAHSASDAQIVSQLKTMNRKLDIVNKNLGGYTSIAPSGGSIQRNLRDICRNTSSSGYSC
jgi:hypothetical protein